MINLWINSETNSLLPNWNAFGTTTLPSIKQGDKIALDIHWVKSDPAGQFIEEVVMHPSSVIKVAVGTISGGPTGGYFVYSYEGDSVNIPYDADVDSFPIVPPPQNYVYVEKNANTLINSLPSIIAAGGVNVSIVNQRTFRIVFNQVGARALSSCDSTTLVPSTNVSVIVINNGDATTKEVHHLRPKLLPVAYSDSFTNSPQPVISIVNIDSITNRISVSPAPKFGTFTISNGTGTTSALSVNASAGDIISGLIAAGISSSTRGYSVAKSGDYSWDIYRTSGTAELLTVSTNGLVGFSSKTGVMDFNTIEVEDLVAGQPSVSAVLEIEYSYGPVRQTLYQGRVTIVNDLIDAATYNPIPFPELNGGIGEAPQDGVLYGRKDGLWSAVVVDGGNIPDYDNGITYTVGSQVYFQGKLYRMTTAVGGAGYDPVSYPSYWESLSGSNPDLSNYVDKDGAVMNIGASLSFVSSFSELTVGAGGVGIYSLSNPESVLLFDNRLEVSNGTNTTKVLNNGILFPDSSLQTTAVTPFDPTGYATEAFVTSQGYITSSALVPYAPLASPAFTGVPTAPTPLASDNSTTIATTAYVTNAVASSTTSPSTEKVTKTVRNATAAIIPKGSVVYVSGANGTHPTILLAQANSELTSYRTFGVTESDIAVNGDGSVVIIGEVADVNTGSFADGDQLYLSPTIAGGITNSKPSAPNHLVYVGVCTRANNSNGKIEVNITNGFELHELHDVAISLPKEDKQLVAYELSSNLWKNKSAATLGIAELSGATFNGKVNTPAPNTTNAGLNIGAWVGGNNNASPTNAVIGDLWVQRNNLQYIDAYGTLRLIPSLSTQNSFVANVFGGQGSVMSITNQSTSNDATALSVTGFSQFGSVGSNGCLRVSSEGTGPTLEVRMFPLGTGDALRVTNRGTGNSLLVEDVLNPDTTSFVINNNGDVGIGVPTTWTSTTKFEVAGTSKFNDKASFTPSATLASINIGSNASSPTSTSSGDIWIGSNNIFFRDNSNASRIAANINSQNTFTSPQIISATTTSTLLRLTQTGTGNALIVEDETNPDTNAFVVNSAGNVGIGVNPSSFSSSVPLTVNGSIVSTTAPAGTNNTIVATTAFVKESIVPQVFNASLTGFPYNTPIGWNTIFRISGGNEMPIELPTDGQNNVPIGTQIVFIQSDSTGTLNFTPQYGAVILSSGNKYRTSGQNAVATAIKVASSEWLIAGDLMV